MNYLTNYYKNLSEQLQNKINNLQQVLLEYEDNPPGGPEPAEPVGDSNAVLSAKKFQVPNNPDDPNSWPFITAQNWQQIYAMLEGWFNGPVPSWFKLGYWGGPDSSLTLQDQWQNFVAFLKGAVLRAGQGNPESYWYVQNKWNEFTTAVDGQPVVFPLRYRAQYFS